jgi:molybdopterin synthase catalytic subunit
VTTLTTNGGRALPSTGSADYADNEQRRTREEVGMADAAVGAVRLAQVRATPLALDEVLDAVRTPAAGGIATFVGVVRDVDDGRAVQRLAYTAHPSVDDVFATIAADVAGRHDVIAVAALHRTGELHIGDIAVVVAVSAAHRGPALAACRDLIDAIKSGIPIWKHQTFADGTDEWVGSP